MATLRCDDLRQLVSGLVPMPVAVFNRVVPLLRTREVTRGTCLLHAGERATTVFFVRRGLLREFYVGENGDEVTRTFCPEGELSGSLADLLSTEGAMVNIDALEDSELLTLPWAGLDALAKASPAWQEVCRRHAEVLVRRKVTREFEMLSLDAAERHRRFITRFPELDARLSRELVASYLGITPVHLSRLRARRKHLARPSRTQGGSPPSATPATPRRRTPAER